MIAPSQCSNCQSLCPASYTRVEPGAYSGTALQVTVYACQCGQVWEQSLAGVDVLNTGSEARASGGPASR